MSPSSYTNEQLQDALNCWHRNGKNQTKAALELGMSRGGFQSRLNKARAIGLNPNIQDDIPFGHNLKGVSTLYDDAGNERLRWVKTSRDEEAMREAILAVIESLSKQIPKESEIAAPDFSDSALMTMYPITDYHIGQLSWKAETGDEWNIDIAEDLLVKWFARAMSLAPPSSMALLANIGDLLHTDSIMPVTPASKHVLDADTRYALTVETVVRVLRRIINMLLEKHEFVHILMEEGNHDESSSIWLRVLFAHLYADNPRISVEQSHLPYHAYQWGDVSLFFHHGHKRKVKELSKVMAGLFRGMYGETKYSYVHTGHLHHYDGKEDQLMLVEQHPTLAAKDAHSARGGYKSLRGASAITYHKNFGEISRVTIRPEMVE